MSALHCTALMLNKKTTASYLRKQARTRTAVNVLGLAARIRVPHATEAERTSSVYCRFLV